MQNITGTLMSEDRVIAHIKNGVITDADDILLPLYLKRTKNIEGWLASRAIDSHRTNSRLLKRALRLRTTDDMQTALAVNAATVTDCYWFRPEGSAAVYEDIRFKENYFSELALRGDPDSFSNRPSRTPELTNTGSFEKCWKLINGEWWMYKSGNEKEYFSELFICRLGEKLGLPMAHYELDGEYIRSKDFTNGADVNFEPMRSLADDDEDYENCFNILNEISPDIAVQYLLLLWMDTVCYNMDRHTENFGLLRDVKTGRIISLAPNYDNNIALIAKGYPTDVRRGHDGLIGFLKTFIQGSEEAHEMYRQMKPPEITERMIDECMDEIPIKADRDYIRSFVLNGQEKVREINEENQMPVEECGNMLIMTAAVTKAIGNTELFDKYSEIAGQWAEYLSEFGADPDNQLCTDDFAGHLAHNCNLALKSVFALASYAKLCSMTGDDIKAEYYEDLARKNAGKWRQKAANGDGTYKLTFDRPGTFSMKYNAVWDKVFDLGIFPENMWEDEIKGYEKHFNPYGLPLDSRSDCTKSDWMIWAATLSGDDEFFKKTVDALWLNYNLSPSRVPLNDLFSSVTSLQIHFQHRSVQGGMFIKLLDSEKICSLKK